MKLTIVVAVALAAVAVAAPPETAKILRSEVDIQPNGNYISSFESDDGITREETGYLKEVTDADNKPHDVIVVKGSFVYVDPDGNTQVINYEADENGYRADGPSIPKGPARR